MVYRDSVASRLAKEKAMDSPTTVTAVDLNDHLRDLLAERALANVYGIDNQEPYVADLDLEIEAYRNAYVAAAVTEIATLRAELNGPLEG
jgi:hypothetical protein